MEDYFCWVSVEGKRSSVIGGALHVVAHASMLLYSQISLVWCGIRWSWRFMATLKVLKRRVCTSRRSVAKGVVSEDKCSNTAVLGWPASGSVSSRCGRPSILLPGVLRLAPGSITFELGRQRVWAEKPLCQRITSAELLDS